MATIERLVAAGVLSFTSHRRLHGASPDPAQEERRKARIKAARADLADAARSLRMAGVLADGGFAAEAVDPLTRAVETALSAFARTAEQPHQAQRYTSTLKRAQSP